MSDKRKFGGKQPGAGHPPAKIDKEELEKLCVLQCTQGEIAAYFAVTRRTIENYAAKPEYGEIMERGRLKGLISVRRRQMQLMDSGNVTMAIWLGKQLLGQKDKMEHDVDLHGSLSIADRLLERRNKRLATTGKGGGVGCDTSRS